MSDCGCYLGVPGPGCADYHGRVKAAKPTSDWKYDGRAIGRHEVAVILRDLIGELRDMESRHYGSRGMTPTAEIREAADKASLRLRQVVGDE